MIFYTLQNEEFIKTHKWSIVETLTSAQSMYSYALQFIAMSKLAISFLL